MTRRAAAVGIAALLLGCGGPTEGGEPVTLHLTTPNASDGAIAVVVTGTGFATVTPGNPGYHVISRQETPDTLKLFVFGNLTDGPLVLLTVEDAGRIAEFGAHVTEVARRDNTIEENRASYLLAFLPADR